MVLAKAALPPPFTQVLECGVSQVSRFDAASGRYTGSFGMAQIRSARDLCVSSDGYVVVANNTKVLVFRPFGTMITAFPAGGPGDADSARLSAVACSTGGPRAVFVSEQASHSVRKLVQKAQQVSAAATHATRRPAELATAGGDAGDVQPG